MQTLNIHATCMRLARAGRPFGAPPGAGILLLGASGTGKSDLALRLLERGAELVADDRTDLFVERARLWARAPRAIAGLMEVRGVGIVKFPHAAKVRVALVVRLGVHIDRIPERQTWLPPSSLALAKPACPPQIGLNAFEPSTPAKIAAAAAAFAHGLFREEVKLQ